MTADPDEIEELRERSEIADRVVSAFAGVELPAPPITEGAGPLNDDVEAALAGKPSAGVTPADAREVRADLAHLTPAALVYYLPALIRIALLSDDDVDGLGEAIFGMLTPPEDRPGLAFFERRAALLDDDQRSALASFLSWYSEGESYLPGRDRALGYWSPAT